MIVLEMPPWESRDPGGTALAQADQLRGDLALIHVTSGDMAGYTSRFRDAKPRHQSAL